MATPLANPCAPKGAVVVRIVVVLQSIAVAALAADYIAPELAVELGCSFAVVVVAEPVAELALLQTCRQASHWQRAESNMFFLHAPECQARQTARQTDLF